MVFFSDSDETVARFSPCIDELHNLFKRSAVDYGAPEDFVAFARRLKRDLQLREDLAVLAKSFMEREKKVSLRTILTIIAVASGGLNVAASDRDLNAPVNQLIDFLISVGGCSQISAQSLDIPCSDAAPDQSPIVDTSSTRAVVPGVAQMLSSQPLEPSDEQPPEQIPAQADLARHSTTDFPIDDSIPDAGIDPIPAEYPAAANPLTESLSRLELSTLEVKLYLDSIEQRISRMEPRLENVPSLVQSAAVRAQRDEPEAKFSAAIAPQMEPQQSLSDHPQPGADPEIVQKPSKAPSSSLETRLHRLLYPHHRAMFPILLALSVVVLAVLLYRIAGRDATHADLHPSGTTLDDNIGASSVEAAPRAGSALARRSADISTLHTTAAAKSRGQEVAAENLSSNPSTSALPTSSNPSDSTSGPVDVATSTSRASAAPPVRATRGYATNPDSRRVNVSSGVMAASLLFAPEPSYPKLASLTHLQGNVVMQAVISKKGAVENLRVIKGHFLLRSAATKAVRSWRFRPYLIDGVPVEVATIVSVDFTLPR